MAVHLRVCAVVLINGLTLILYIQRNVQPSARVIFISDHGRVFQTEILSKMIAHQINGALKNVEGVSRLNSTPQKKKNTP